MNEYYSNHPQGRKNEKGMRWVIFFIRHIDFVKKQWLIVIESNFNHPYSYRNTTKSSHLAQATVRR